MDNAKVSIINGDKYILCDYEQPFISENIDVEEESLLPETFCRLFYLFLAQKISKMAGSKAEIRQEIAAEINSQLSIALTVANREDLEGDDFKNYYVDVRQ